MKCVLFLTDLKKINKIEFSQKMAVMHQERQQLCRKASKKKKKHHRQRRRDPEQEVYVDRLHVLPLIIIETIALVTSHIKLYHETETSLWFYDTINYRKKTGVRFSNGKVNYRRLANGETVLKLFGKSH